MKWHARILKHAIASTPTDRDPWAIEITVTWRGWFGLGPTRVNTYAGTSTVWRDKATGERAGTANESWLARQAWLHRFAGKKCGACCMETPRQKLERLRKQSRRLG